MFLKYLKRALHARQSRRLNLEGDELWQQGRIGEAEKCFRQAMALTPDYALPFSNLGAMLMGVHRYDEGFTLLKKAQFLNPAHPGILVNLGNAYMLAGQLQNATGLYQKALEIDPENTPVMANLIRPLTDLCDWEGLTTHLNRIKGYMLRHPDADPSSLIAPFNSLFLPLSRAEQKHIAIQAGAGYAKQAAYQPPVRRDSPGSKNPRIRIGYLSADFHDHATAHLTLGIYKRHDRSRFEVYAYSIGYQDEGPYRREIVQSCDHFHDVHECDDYQIAQKIAADNIDILLDMKGYTGASRPGILALRPAPIQVNYLGYPGTMGADFIDYLIADPFIIPESHESDYTEKIVRLPDCYQPNNCDQVISTRFASRQDAGLPEGRFVWCAFHVPGKIDRRSFSCWMKILAATPDSVLWLLEPSHDARIRLCKTAEQNGVAVERLIFAPLMAKPDHLCRLQFADVFLDTQLYNAHTTSSDALWAGVPVLTLCGETFASRVATSLLNAVDLPWLSTANEADYIGLAVALEKDRPRLDAAKQHLRQKDKLRLFDTNRYTRNFDDALYAIYTARQHA